MWYSVLDDGECPIMRWHESSIFAELDLGKATMEFRLVYQGPLHADRGTDEARQARRKHKHAIRRRFHEQLTELWNRDTRLVVLKQNRLAHEPESYLEYAGKMHEAAGIQWVPIVSDGVGAACSLDILFLRHEPKGGIIQSGDLDNRIKTLFDALRIPDKSEIPDEVSLSPENEPKPFFCLLSNDKLITEF